MKITAFAGSNSSTSVNKKLATYTASYFTGDEIKILDLNDYEMPLYSVDKELKRGIPQPAFEFANEIDNSDLLIISLAEHNGSYSTAFKNIFDWISRIPERKTFGNKPVFLMAAAPGPRGGATVLEIAKNRFPYNGGLVLDTFSLPNFNVNFDDVKGITNITLKTEFENKIKSITHKLKN